METNSKESRYLYKNNGNRCMKNGKIKWLFFRKGLYSEIIARKNKWSGKIEIGHNFSIGRGSKLERYMNGNIIISDNVSICENCKIATCGGNIVIGENSTLGDYTTITAQGGIKIGSNVIFADKISLIANEHIYENTQIPIMLQGCIDLPIVIGDGTWVGINATILGGTTIGKNCVVAAGAIVKGNFPDYCVIGGVPGKIIKKYDEKLKEWR